MTGNGGAPQPMQIRPEELRPLPCPKCGHNEYEPRPYVVVMRHVFKAELVFYIKKERYHCKGLACTEVITP